MSTTWALIISVLLLVANGFFVAAEFALVASKRHRLEQAAAAGNRSARSAIAGVRELSVMLAGAQLGITLSTLGLGALAEPAFDHLLHPVFDAIGLPSGFSYVLAFLLAIVIVSFLHVVVGEMAPKSWAISHPERSALLLARPFRAFTWVTRPALLALNRLANAILRLFRVQPQDELAQVHGADELRLLLQSSREHGTIAAAEHELLTAMLAVQNTTVAQVMTPLAEVVSVPPSAPAREVELTSRSSGRSRLAVISGDGAVRGFVHVREAVRATTAGTSMTASDLMSSPLTLGAALPVAAAVRMMREHRAQLAVVTSDDDVVGVVGLEDMLEELIGEFDDETDRIVSAATRR
ncbi:hemolysin family protein [Asanoa sp. WMMD1127]|uniref:hemolysin family protein n=1 Tax=Asanoa sp. WMMD1127 TaxID=3016107 RepID=UPI002416A280|nr:hemolysin family protein [Asanoa sp. WMMD1127]MDG4821743.1 hemolysin family protein [Asanoa sp. WMMD1127]